MVASAGHKIKPPISTRVKERSTAMPNAGGGQMQRNGNRGNSLPLGSS